MEKVTLATDVTIKSGGSLGVFDELELSDNATITLASDGALTQLRFAGPLSTDAAVLSGTGEVVFSGTTTLDDRNRIEASNFAQSLTIGPDITVRTGTAQGVIAHRFDNGPITIEGAVISDVPTYAVSLSGEPLTIDGAIKISAGSVVNVLSDYSLSSTASLDVEIAGFDPSQFGRVTGPTSTANLDGALNLTLVNGFAPSLNEMFQIMSFAGLNGGFATENGTSLGGGLSFDVNYNATDVTLEVTE